MKLYGKSPNFKKPKILKNAIVQSIAGGNTLCWSKKFHKLLISLPKPNPASHDWYIYQVATFFELNFLFITKPTLIYRQHDNNVIGANTGIINLTKRIYWGLRGLYKHWHDINEEHLINLSEKFKSKQIASSMIVKDFYEIRKNRFNSITLIKKGYFRQTVFGQLMLITASILSKI